MGHYSKGSLVQRVTGMKVIGTTGSHPEMVGDMSHVTVNLHPCYLCMLKLVCLWQVCLHSGEMGTEDLRTGLADQQ